MMTHSAHISKIITIAVALAACTLVLAAGEMPPSRATPQTHALDWIRPSKDNTHFVGGATGGRIVMWGFNYDRDDADRREWLPAAEGGPTGLGVAAGRDALASSSRN